LEKLISTQVGIKNKNLKLLKIIEYNKRLTDTIRSIAPHFRPDHSLESIGEQDMQTELEEARFQLAKVKSELEGHR